MAYVNALIYCPELKWEASAKGRQAHCSLDVYISTEDEVTTVSGKEFQILIIRTEKKSDLKLWYGVDTGLSLMEFLLYHMVTS